MKRLLGACVIFVCCMIASASAEKPNVIYILADDLGYGDLSCYGQQKFETPNIDRLASEGMKFTAHYSGNTVCTPSRAVLMTGQHSGHCHVRGNLGGETGAPLDPKMIVLPELFKAAGYATALSANGASAKHIWKETRIPSLTALTNITAGRVNRLLTLIIRLPSCITARKFP